MPEMHKADPRARPMALAIIAGGTLLGVVVIAVATMLQPGFKAWVEEDLAVRLRIVLGVMTLLTVGPSLGMAAYMWRLGRRIMRAERYPPPGFRVVRDTPVVTGPVAGRRGRVMQALAVVIAVASVILAILLWRLLFLLEAGR